MFNITHSMGRVARMFGLLALVAALASAFAVTPGTAAAADQAVGTLAVHTSAESGGNVSNALVRLYNQAGTNVAKAVTDATGKAAFKVVAGIYKVAITAQSYESTSTAAEVTAGKLVNLAVSLKNAAPSPGTALGELQMQVRSEAGTSIAQAEVYLRNVQNQVVTKGQTDAAGKLTLLAPEGKYSVEVLAPGYKDYKTPSRIQVFAGQTTNLAVALQADARIGNN